MNKITALSLLLCAAQLMAADPQGRPVIGVYTGWEPLPEMKEEAGAEWFRLHRITVRGDTVELFGNPAAIRGRDLAFSASEGGFLVYTGEFYHREGELRIKFTPVTETEDGEVLETYGGVLAEEDVAVEIIDLVSFKLSGVVYTLQGRNPHPGGSGEAQQ